MDHIAENSFDSVEGVISSQFDDFIPEQIFQASDRGASPPFFRYTLNQRGSAERLSEASTRIFARENSDLRVTQFHQSQEGIGRNVSRLTVATPQEFMTKIASSKKDDRLRTELFFAFQDYTWSLLGISGAVFGCLASHLNPYPRLFDIIRTFGEKAGPVEESLSTYYDNLSTDSTSFSGADFEIGYTLKHIELHGRAFPTDPFSVREVAIYHKWNHGAQRNSWFFVQATENIRQGVERVCSQSEPHQFLLHTTLLLETSEKWRDYIRYLEDEFSNMLDRSAFASLKGSSKEGALDVDLSEFRRLQIFTDKLLRISHLLNLNLSVGVRVSQFIQRLRSKRRNDGDPPNASIEDPDGQLGEFFFMNETHKARVDSMVTRGQGISSLMKSTLDLRAADSSRQTNETSNEISQRLYDMSRQNMKVKFYMRQMAQRSTRDTRSMMIIALITAIFLPATLVATLFGSNFFGFINNGGKARLQIATNFWIYVVATVILLAMTLTGWWWCLNVTKFPSHDDDDANDVDLEAQKEEKETL
ncbi:MAG: hypothetical protein M1814_005910 [Vezdaea aestivalis]|nr:MAG: hypothetical protein M1814_005910 [Vezdaea aestivalis]